MGRLSHKVAKAATEIAKTAGDINVGEGRVHASVAGASIMMAVQLQVRDPICCPICCGKQPELPSRSKSDALYLATALRLFNCFLQINQPDWRPCKEISDASGAAEATIRLIFRDMYAKRMQLVPEWYATKQEIEQMSPN